MRKASVRALVFDGIRRHESHSREGYNAIAIGAKHRSQVNARPVMSWNSGEIYTYLLAKDLLLNTAYRQGLSRVGCAICPFGSSWSEAITRLAYGTHADHFISILREQLKPGYKPENWASYIGQGDWKNRAGGRTLGRCSDKVTISEEKMSLRLLIRQPNESWSEWIKTLGLLRMPLQVKPDRWHVGDTCQADTKHRCANQDVAQARSLQVSILRSLRCVFCGMSPRSCQRCTHSSNKRRQMYALWCLSNLYGEGLLACKITQDHSGS
ncbi:MAG: phosphoadenosine phosphosulfate reductase family protein [Desulfomonilaceae bacterium]